MLPRVCANRITRSNPAVALRRGIGSRFVAKSDVRDGAIRTRTGLMVGPVYMAVRNAVIASRQMRSLALVAARSATASAAPMTITGDVINVRSRWTADRSRIVTEATVHTATGDVVVSQLGGSVDGIAMRTFPGPEPLVPGMRVTLAAHQRYDLSQ